MKRLNSKAEIPKTKNFKSNLYGEGKIEMISKKLKGISAGSFAVLMASQAMIPLATSALEVPYANRTKEDAFGNSTYKERFLSLYDDVVTKGQENGYLSSDNVASGGFGVPYHSVETLIVEAPDYGHETTSEAMSYIVWVAAMRDALTKGTADASSDLAKAWKTMEVIIPTMQEGFWRNNPSATYADEYDTPEEYPSPNQNGNTGSAPLFNAFKQAYSSDDGLYLMHWLADVDNWYGYGGSGKDFTFINTFQRGAQESCWETIPHPSIEEFKYGNSQSGIIGALSADAQPAKQWRYTNAPDAEDRAIQAVFEANRAGVGDSNVTTLAGKMADQIRSNMFDKYYKALGCQSKNVDMGGGSGYKSCHYLNSWYTSWGGALDGAWTWQIGASHIHEFYQNPLQAYAVLVDSDLNSAMKAEGATKDWETSLTRQLEFYQWLQSAEGPIAGGCTNSWNGRYETYPSGQSTFYDMAYLEHPVYLDPGSNHWIGNQVWAMQRLAELYYTAKEDGDSTVTDMSESVITPWVQWAVENIHFDDDIVAEYGNGATYAIPASLDWEGQPETWNGTKPANSNLHAIITAYGSADIGCVASFADTLIYYAKAEGVEASTDADGSLVFTGGSELGQKALTVAKELLDRLWEENRDDIGVAKADTNTSFKRLFEQEVWVPNNYKGTMPNGDKLETGATFYSIRTMYKDDPRFAELEADYNDNGETDTTEFTYHRFWHQGDVLIALGALAQLFPEVTPDGDSSSETTTTTTTTETTETTTTTSGTTTSGEEGDVKWGDVNCDGKVNIADLFLLAQHIAALTTVEGQGFKNADVANDGKVNIADLFKLAQYVAQLIDYSELGKK